jgi:hypothetical protein
MKSIQEYSTAVAATGLRSPAVRQPRGRIGEAAD